jgi:ribosomal protein S18 acetylase RimI-like enzyme
VPAIEYVHVTEDRIDDLIEVLAKSKVDDPHERRLSPEEARAFYIEDPDFDLNGTWIAMSGRDPVAVGWVIVEENRLAAGKDDAYMEVDVVPEYRGSGIEEELMRKCLDYIRSRGVGKARSRGVQGSQWKKSLLEANDFVEAYRVYDLVRSGRGDVPVVRLPEGYTLENRDMKGLTDDELLSAVDAFNESFLDHYNFVPERPERFLSIRDSAKDPWAAIVVKKGDEIAGVCLVEKSDSLNQEKEVSVGWVIVLGVRPAHRRQGLARAMLASAIEWLMDQGLESVFLSVQSVNEKALDLYKSLGFEKDGEQVSYVRSPQDPHL